MFLDGAKLVSLDANGDRVVEYLAKGRKFAIGTYLSCDYIPDDARAKGVHCEINCDSFGRVTIHNFSEEHPISVNGQIINSGCRPLLNGSRVSILDKLFVWEFPKNRCNEREMLPDDSVVSTPTNQIGPAERPPTSCPEFGEKLCAPKRLTFHNIMYCIQFDELGNSSVEANESLSGDLSAKKIEVSLDESEKNEVVSQCRSKTPENLDVPSNIPIMETPNISLLHSTKNKENTSTKKKQQLLSLCEKSDILITSYSPRTAGVCVEKSFTRLIKPNELTTNNSSKSEYSTPKIVRSVSQNSPDIMDLSTPTTSKNTRNTSMNLIDLTTPNRFRPICKIDSKTAKNTPMTLSKVSTGSSVYSVNSLDNSIVEVSSSNTSDSPLPAPRLHKTPSKLISAGTPKRTPHSLMKRALLTTTKKQVNARRSHQSPITPKSASARSAVEVARRQCLTTPTRKFQQSEVIVPDQTNTLRVKRSLSMVSHENKKVVPSTSAGSTSGSFYHDSINTVKNTPLTLSKFSTHTPSTGSSVYSVNSSDNSIVEVSSSNTPLPAPRLHKTPSKSIADGSTSGSFLHDSIKVSSASISLIRGSNSKEFTASPRKVITTPSRISPTLLSSRLVNKARKSLCSPKASLSSARARALSYAATHTPVSILKRKQSNQTPGIQTSNAKRVVIPNEETPNEEDKESTQEKFDQTFTIDGSLNESKENTKLNTSKISTQLAEHSSSQSKKSDPVLDNNDDSNDETDLLLSKIDQILNKSDELEKSTNINDATFEGSKDSDKDSNLYDDKDSNLYDEPCTDKYLMHNLSQNEEKKCGTEIIESSDIDSKNLTVDIVTSTDGEELFSKDKEVIVSPNLVTQQNVNDIKNNDDLKQSPIVVESSDQDAKPEIEAVENPQTTAEMLVSQSEATDNELILSAEDVLPVDEVNASGMDIKVLTTQTPRRSARRASLSNLSKHEVKTDNFKKDGSNFTPKRKTRRASLSTPTTNTDLTRYITRRSSCSAMASNKVELMQGYVSKPQSGNNLSAATAKKVLEVDETIDDMCVIVEEGDIIDAHSSAVRKNNVLTDSDETQSSALVIEESICEEIVEKQPDSAQAEKIQQENESQTSPKVVELLGEDYGAEVLMNDTVDQLKKGVQDDVNSTPISKKSNDNFKEEVESQVDYQGMRELLKTPKGSSTPRLRGIREMIKTPKLCESPKLGGIRELINTPRASTSSSCITVAVSKTSIDELQSTINQNEDERLEKFFKTPRSKNLMMPNDPASAILKRNDIEGLERIQSTECDLNASNATIELEKLFETPDVKSCFTEKCIKDDNDQVETLNEKILDPKLSKNESNKETPKRNISAEEAFDELVGFPSTFHTPVQKSYERKSQKVSQSPFSSTDVISDLPKTDIQEWVDNLEETENDIVELDYSESIINLTTESAQDKDPLNETKTTESKQDGTLNEAKSFVKVDVADNEINVTISSEKVMDVSTVSTINDPLTSTAYKLVEPESTSKDLLMKEPNKATVKSRSTTPNELDMSGLQLLDETTESVMEPLVVSSIESLDNTLEETEPAYIKQSTEQDNKKSNEEISELNPVVESDIKKTLVIIGHNEDDTSLVIREDKHPDTTIQNSSQIVDDDEKKPKAIVVEDDNQSEATIPESNKHSENKISPILEPDSDKDTKHETSYSQISLIVNNVNDKQLKVSEHVKENSLIDEELNEGIKFEGTTQESVDMNESKKIELLVNKSTNLLDSPTPENITAKANKTEESTSIDSPINTYDLCESAVIESVVEELEQTTSNRDYSNQANEIHVNTSTLVGIQCYKNLKEAEDKKHKQSNLEDSISNSKQNDIEVEYNEVINTDISTLSMKEDVISQCEGTNAEGKIPTSQNKEVRNHNETEGALVADTITISEANVIVQSKVQESDDLVKHDNKLTADSCRTTVSMGTDETVEMTTMNAENDNQEIETSVEVTSEVEKEEKEMKAVSSVLLTTSPKFEEKSTAEDIIQKNKNKSIKEEELVHPSSSEQKSEKIIQCDDDMTEIVVKVISNSDTIINSSLSSASIENSFTSGKNESLAGNKEILQPTPACSEINTDQQSIQDFSNSDLVCTSIEDLTTTDKLLTEKKSTAAEVMLQPKVDLSDDLENVVRGKTQEINEPIDYQKSSVNDSIETVSTVTTTDEEAPLKIDIPTDLIANIVVTSNEAIIEDITKKVDQEIMKDSVKDTDDEASTATGPTVNISQEEGGGSNQNLSITTATTQNQANKDFVSKTSSTDSIEVEQSIVTVHETASSKNSESNNEFEQTTNFVKILQGPIEIDSCDTDEGNTTENVINDDSNENFITENCEINVEQPQERQKSKEIVSNIENLRKAVSIEQANQNTLFLSTPKVDVIEISDDTSSETVSEKSLSVAVEDNMSTSERLHLKSVKQVTVFSANPLRDNDEEEEISETPAKIRGIPRRRGYNGPTLVGERQACIAMQTEMGSNERESKKAEVKIKLRNDLNESLTSPKSHEASSNQTNVNTEKKTVTKSKDPQEFVLNHQTGRKGRLPSVTEKTQSSLVNELEDGQLINKDDVSQKKCFSTVEEESIITDKQNLAGEASPKPTSVVDDSNTKTLRQKRGRKASANADQVTDLTSNEELNSSKRESRNIPRHNYDETFEDETPTKFTANRSRRMRKVPSKQSPLAQAQSSSSVEPEQLETVNVQQMPTDLIDDSSKSKREGRNLPRRNYNETSGDEKIEGSTASRTRRIRKPTTKALEVERETSPKRRRAVSELRETVTPKRQTPSRSKGLRKAKADLIENDDQPTTSLSVATEVVCEDEVPNIQPAKPARGGRRKVTAKTAEQEAPNGEGTNFALPILKVDHKEEPNTKLSPMRAATPAGRAKRTARGAAKKKTSDVENILTNEKRQDENTVPPEQNDHIDEKPTSKVTRGRGKTKLSKTDEKEDTDKPATKKASTTRGRAAKNPEKEEVITGEEADDDKSQQPKSSGRKRKASAEPTATVASRKGRVKQQIVGTISVENVTEHETVTATTNKRARGKVAAAVEESVEKFAPNELPASVPAPPPTRTVRGRKVHFEATDLPASDGSDGPEPPKRVTRSRRK